MRATRDVIWRRTDVAVGVRIGVIRVGGLVVGVAEAVMHVHRVAASI